jgi:tetratricopeptide (TPR) repeat protein
MVGDFGEVQVMDWGLAKQHDTAEPTEPGEPAARVQTTTDANRTTVYERPDESTDARTVAGQVMGTPTYMSPEQARGDTSRVGCRSDVFALGGVLCAILTGKPPFTGGGEQTIRRAAAGDLAEAFARLDGCGADAELIALAKRCLAPAPDERPANGAVVAELVATYRAGVEHRLRAAEMSRAATEAKAAEQRKRRRAQTALAGAIVLLLAGLGAFGWWADRQTRARKAERERIETETRAAQERAYGEKRAADLRRQLDDERRAADERSRLARNGDAITALVDRCEDHLQRGETEVAGLALAEAERRAKEGGDPVAARLARCRADFVLLAKLDAVDRFAWSPINWNLPANTQIVILWRDTFGNAEMFGNRVAPKDAAARVKQSLVADKLLTALDSWLALEQSNWLRDTLHAADPDSYRDTVRAALRAGDKARLVELIGQPPVEQQPARFAAAVGYIDAVPVARRLKVLEVALRARPDALALLMLLGNLNDRDDRAGARLRWYQAAVAAHPRNAAARVGLGDALGHSGDPDGALTSLREALRLDPNLAPAHLELADQLAAAGKVEAAITSYREAVRLDPNNTGAHFNLGVALVDIGDLDGALVSIKEASRLDPADKVFASAIGKVEGAIKKRGPKPEPPPSKQ